MKMQPDRDRVATCASVAAIDGTIVVACGFVTL